MDTNICRYGINTAGDLLVFVKRDNREEGPGFYVDYTLQRNDSDREHYAFFAEDIEIAEDFLPTLF